MRLSSLPALELVEQCLLLRVGDLGSAERVLTEIEEAGEHRLHILWRHVRDNGVAVQPGLRWRKACPARRVGSEIDLAPFRMVSRLQQRPELGEERVDEIA